MIAQDQRGDLPEERPLASDTKPPASIWKECRNPTGPKPYVWLKVLCTTGKISDFTAACPRERGILPPPWNRMLSSHLTEDSCLVSTGCDDASMGPVPCSRGSLGALTPRYPPLNITFMDSFYRSLSGQDRTEQCLQSTFLSKYAYQQSQNY